jgi:hypothetical protein
MPKKAENVESKSVLSNPPKLLGLSLIIFFILNLIIALVFGQAIGMQRIDSAHSTPQEFICPYDSLRFSSYDSLYAHLLTHQIVTPLGPNLLFNPSVEDDTDDDGQPDYWIENNYTEITTIFSWTSEANHTGTYGLSLAIQHNPDAESWKSAQWRQFFYFDEPNCPIQVGKSYKFRCWMRVGYLNTAYLWVGFWTSEEWLSGQEVGVNRWSEGTTQWLTFTVPTDAKSMAIGVLVYNKDASADVVINSNYVDADDFELYETAPSMPLGILVGITGTSEIDMNFIWIAVLAIAVVLLVVPRKPKLR